ncbi:MAG: hypothetical protein AVDCRST_MAG93-3068 [uncultured Chloroflexia bacterium]|uniref:Uncharacterized protein n=1 Tax=uncultured Chloroflexia bacterium TaxID=1672391 RepID=A0A6J4JFD7_9CHLR|nr:MAG: hypothetical protein AVDCRST_MAG93-3068 [uncultured Chloroflexia bacterium]
MPPNTVVMAYLISGRSKMQACFPTSKLGALDVGIFLDL